LRLIVTQVLHWGAFLLVMNIVLLSSVQRVFTAQTTALAIFTLLALGTFTAGVQVLSWQACLLGVIMALGIPAIAWIENSALADRLLAGMVLIANQATASRTGSPCRLSPSRSNGTSTKAKAVKAADTRISGASLL
jgi:hypothetical protein